MTLRQKSSGRKPIGRAALATSTAMIVCALLAPTAQAQDGTDSDAQDPRSRLVYDAPEIIVTARRRAENVQDVPISLTVVNGEALERTNTNNVGQLTQLAPSVQLLSSNPRNTAITIRGLGASYGLANDGLEQGVGVYVDQVYNARPATATLDFVDLDRIEILRGPQGTLFGKNTTAGALNITTRSASFTPEATIEGTVGDYGLDQFKLSVSGPLIGDLVAGRLSVVSTDRDGFIRNTTTGQLQNDAKSISLRGQLLIEPSPALTVRLYADYSRQETECCTQVYVRVAPTLRPAAQQYPSLAAGRGYAPPSLNPYDRLADVDADIQADQTHLGFSAITDYDFGPVTLTSITAYREWEWDPANDRDYIALDIVRQSANPSEQDQFSQEFRLASNGDSAVSWVGGLYYFNQTVATTGVTEYGSDATYWLLGGGLPDALLDGYRVFNTSSITTDSYAVFGQLTWEITDGLRITPGLRYTVEDKSGSYLATVEGGLASPTPAQQTRRLGIARPQFYEAETSDDSLSGQVAVSYDVTDDVLAYVSYARGNKSGGINMAGIPTLPDGRPALNSAVVRPEDVTTYEVGLKTQAFDRHLTANLALYRTEIEDFQANVVDAGPGALRGYLANVERVEIQGAELDLAFQPIDAFSAYANIAYTDGEYASFTNGPCPLERVGTSTAACDLSGEQFPGVSPWAVSTGGEYRLPFDGLGQFGELYLGADASYRSTYNSDATVSDYTEIEGYALVNLRTGFRSDDNWEAYVFVKNAFGEDYLQFVSVQTGNSGLVIGNPGDPRTIGVTIRARY